MNNIIIHPTDFSECSKVAFEYSIHLAEIFNCELLLVHSIDLSQLDAFDQTGHTLLAKSKQIEEEAEKKLRALGDAVTEKGIECRAKLYSGNITDWLPKLIHEENPYLVLMGTTGAGSIGNKFFGSNASAITQVSTAPVLAIPVNSTLNSLKTIDFAANLENVNEATLNFVNHISAKLNSELQLVYVCSEDKKENGAKVIEQVKTNLTKLEPVQRRSFKSILSDSYISGISEHVSEHKSDLLALVKTNKNFIAKFFYGSLSDQMIHYSDIPLLIIPEELRE